VATAKPLKRFVIGAGVRSTERRARAEDMGCRGSL
jgi:hypothetical protein